MDDIVIRDERRGQEVHIKRNTDGDWIGIEMLFDSPRPIGDIINYSAVLALAYQPPGAATMPRPCGGGGKEK